MKGLLMVLISVILVSAVAFGNVAGDEVTNSAVHKTSISGKIVDKLTNEKLVCATVQVEGTEIKTSTDIEGRFEIKGLDPGSYSLKVTYISYKETTVSNIVLKEGADKGFVVNLEPLN